MNFSKKIAEYIEDEETNFTIFTNKPGLQNFTDVIATHARKCDKDITPCFNGFKVLILTYRPKCHTRGPCRILGPCRKLVRVALLTCVALFLNYIKLGCKRHCEDCMRVWLHKNL